MARKSSEFVTKAVLFLLLVCICNKINATNYIVGDDIGWSMEIDMETWPNGKTFYVGDVLEFKYDDPMNMTNVYVTDEPGFLSCAINDNSTVHESGDDKIPLPYGTNYFMSGFPEQCQGGLKMSLFANSPPQL